MFNLNTVTSAYLKKKKKLKKDKQTLLANEKNIDCGIGYKIFNRKAFKN
jgi:hypothetical protein